MNFPRLSSGNVVALLTEWRRLWNDRIVPMLNSFNIIAGSGIQVDRRANGWVISSAAEPTGRGGDSTAFPLFVVTHGEGGNLDVSGGYVNRNGLAMTWWPGGSVKAETGTLCICSEPVDKLGNWSPVSVKIVGAPSPFAYPIAAVKVDGAAVIVEQYPVSVATIIYSKRCPIAEL